MTKKNSQSTLTHKLIGGLELEIEKNESLPEVKSPRYPFEQMEVGDSVLVTDLPKAESIQNAAYAWGKKNGTGFKMTRRKVDNGYRVWRIV